MLTLQVSKIVSKRPLTTLHSSLPSLCGLIARADLCIGGGVVQLGNVLHYTYLQLLSHWRIIKCLSLLLCRRWICVYVGTSSSITTDAIHSHIDQFLSSQKLSTMSLKLSSAPFGTSPSSLVDHLLLNLMLRDIIYN